jgi:hypothetical protein
MLVAVGLVTNYEKISRRGTATILLSKRINCIATEKLLIGIEIYFKLNNEKKILKFLDKNSAMQCCVLCPFLVNITQKVDSSAIFKSGYTWIGFNSRDSY